jgi:hypothetical protein
MQALPISKQICLILSLTARPGESTVRLTKAHRLTDETKTMIPKEARDLIDLNLELARTTEFETQAEHYLRAAESMFSFALAAGMITVRAHSSEIIGISLIRAQRKTAAEELKAARTPVKWPAPKDDGAYRFDPMSGTFQN